MLSTPGEPAQGPVDLRVLSAGLFWFLHCSFLTPFHGAQVGLKVPGNPVYLGLYLLSVALVWVRVTSYPFAVLPWLYFKRKGWL